MIDVKRNRNKNFGWVIVSAICTFLLGKIIISCSFFDDIFLLYILVIMSMISIICVIFSAYCAFTIDRILSKKYWRNVG